jgi:hypothetical protein
MPAPEEMTVDVAGGRLELPAAGVVLRASRLVDVDLSAQRPAVFKAFASTFEWCDLTGASLRAGSMGAGAEPTVWRGCRFRKSDLRGILPGTARFEECLFDGARLDGWLCRNAEFVGCTFSGTLREIVFSGRPIATTVVTAGGGDPNEIRGNDFSGAVLEGVEFVRGIDLAAQRLPAGPEYVRVPDARGAVERALRAVAGWSDGAEREAAERMLRRFTTRGYEDQQDIFTRRDRPPGVPDGVRERVWSLLLGGA